MEEESFVTLTAVLVGDFSASVTVTFPKSSIANFLNLKIQLKKRPEDIKGMTLKIEQEMYFENVVAGKDTAGVAVVLVFADRALKFLLYSQVFLIFRAQINQHRADDDRRRATRWSQTGRIPAATRIRSRNGQVTIELFHS